MKKEQLIEEAIKARQLSYSPYSNFAVGAALLTQANQVIWGCNIENASYGLSNCAERTAIYKAMSEAKQLDEKTFVSLAVVADTDRPVPPCGACRQVLVEFCKPDMPVYLANLNGAIEETTVSELLPGAFTPDDLKE